MKIAIFTLLILLISSVVYVEEGMYVGKPIDRNTLKFNDLKLIIKKPDNWTLQKTEEPYSLLAASKYPSAGDFEPFILVTLNTYPGASLEEYSNSIRNGLSALVETKRWAVLEDGRCIDISGQKAIKTVYLFDVNGRSLLLTSVIFIKDRIGYSIMYKNEEKNITRDGKEFEYILRNIEFTS